MNQTKKREYKTEEDGLTLPSFPHPKSLVKARRYNDVMFVPPVGHKQCDIMFISPSVQQEEVADEQPSRFGQAVKQEPRMLRGPAGAIFQDILRSQGINPDDIYYTSVCKWLLPKAIRNKPKKAQLDYGKNFLMEEIRQVHPKIIVCMGKHVFDTLYPIKFKMRDIQGGWFWSEDLQTRLFVMPAIIQPVVNPDYIDKFMIDVKAIKRLYDKVQGIDVPTIPLNYTVASTKAEVQKHVMEWAAGNYKVFSVDCEWKGRHHVEGELRSIQFCWKDGRGVYIRFMDDNLNYTMDASYKEIGAILGKWLDKTDVKYIGHHYAADAPWMMETLGLDCWGKCIFDSEFAQQVADEYEDLALERLAMKYTDLGRYDIELEIWKKKYNAKRCKAAGLSPDIAAYAFIPDNVLISYATKDVDTVFRAYPHIMEDLRRQGLTDYYNNTVNPFVTDVFLNFVTMGLPVEMKLLESIREVYVYAQKRMEVMLREMIHKEAWLHIRDFMVGIDLVKGFSAYKDFREFYKDGDFETAFELLKGFSGISNVSKAIDLYEHLQVSAEFNIRSGPQMRRWLFDIKGYIPVKSTKRDDAGMPSMPWTKILTYPTEVQKKYTPACDKQTVEMLAEEYSDEVLDRLMELNAVGNLTKGVLKPADVGADGELVKENGIPYWVASDGFIHGQYSCTETGRPRSWNPNSLNLPKYVTTNITAGIQRVIEMDSKAGTLPEFMNPYVGLDPKQFPSVRSCISTKEMEPLPGSEGWCIVESDLDTAEIVGAAYTAGDFQMISAAIDPDPAFGLADLGEGKIVPIRLAYADNCGIDPLNQNPQLLRKYSKGHGWGDICDNATAAWAEIDKMCKNAPDKYARSFDGYIELIDITDDQWVKDENGRIVNPRHDLHWEIAESVMRNAREVLSKDKHRDGVGKPANFSIAYGATPNSLERAVKSATKEEPPEGTGDLMLEAYAERYPGANKFFLNQEFLPEDPGYYRSISGRIRHFKVHGAGDYGINERLRGSKLTSEQRQARNFPLQNNVGDTMTLAAIGLLKDYKRLGLKARPMALLYDAMATLCPFEEREQVLKLHNKWMHEEVFWETPGGILRYTIDSDYCVRWSTKNNDADSEWLGKTLPAVNIRNKDPLPEARRNRLIELNLLAPTKD